MAKVVTGHLPPESLSALVDASAAINSAQGLDETLAAIARAAASVMRAEASSVIVLDEQRGKQVFAAAVGDRADQLLGVVDVTAEMDAALAPARDEAARTAARREASNAIQARLRPQYAQPGDSVWVQVMPLYNGARTSAYVFRRYTDIRLVVAAAAEHLARFGMKDGIDAAGIERTRQAGFISPAMARIDDGFDFVLQRFFIKIDRPQDGAVIGQGHGRHLEGEGFFQQVIDFEGRIEQAVF